jgi:hypothetical protein
MDDVDSNETVRGLTKEQCVFERYRLARILGRGGMGVVWLAHDNELDRDVALKFLPEPLTADVEALDDLRKETRRALTLTHPNLVRIFDFERDERHAAISMEYVEGKTLGELRIEKPNKVFEVGELASIVTQVCGALNYAHFDAKTVHRDLKPANLMVTSDGKVKIMDFGIARSITDSMTRMSRATNSSGTLVYMSPQQLMGGTPSITDDIYALGATVYELITGKPVFYSGDISAQIRESVPVSLVRRRESLGIDGAPIPIAWERAVQKCLEKDPEKRPSSAEAVASLLGLSVPTFVRPAGVGEPCLGEIAEEIWVGRISPKRIVQASLVAGIAFAATGLTWYQFIAAPRDQLESARTVTLEHQISEIRARRRDVEEKQRQHLNFLAKCRAELDSIRARIVAEQLTAPNLSVLDQFGGPDWKEIRALFETKNSTDSEIEAKLAAVKQAELALPTVISRSRQAQLVEEFALAKQQYESVLAASSPEFLDKWGDSSWATLKARAIQYSNGSDLVAATAFFRQAVRSVSTIMSEAAQRSESFNKKNVEETERRLAEAQRVLVAQRLIEEGKQRDLFARMQAFTAATPANAPGDLEIVFQSNDTGGKIFNVFAKTIGLGYSGLWCSIDDDVPKRIPNNPFRVKLSPGTHKYKIDNRVGTSSNVVAEETVTITSGVTTTVELAQPWRI